MEKVSALEARKNLGRLLNIVSLRKEDIVIERAGTPIAKLTPIEPRSIQKSGQLDFRKMRGVGKDLWKKTNVDAYLKDERNQWD